MKSKPTLDDLIGVEYSKLGFFRELQHKIAELEVSNFELARKQQQIQAILDGISDVMIVLSLDFRIVSVNQEFHNVFRIPEPEGRLCYEAFHNLRQPCSPCPMTTALDSNQVCRSLQLYPMDGKNRHFEITASPLRNPDGEPSLILLLMRDVTLEKELQAKYHQAQRMATVGVLAAGVAHEINNPLTAISGFAEGLKRRLPRLDKTVDREIMHDFNEYLGIILKECQRCQGIVQSLLTFGRQTLAESSPVNLSSLVNDTLKLLQNQLKQYRKRLVRVDLEASLPSVQGDESHLKQVILNLLFNALDATHEKGSIILRTYSENQDWVAFSVEDSGCGIPAENMDKLFEPFFTTKPVGKGIGIGLSTCYNIVTKHGGEILVESELGKGSTFVVKLPRENRDGGL
ncbi:MAG TPA: ATP-binding protein [Desulfomonilaceae bacterium]|nr:ATP-binding protein [Desulfomonilaceae bacterium]